MSPIPQFTEGASHNFSKPRYFFTACIIVGLLRQAFFAWNSILILATSVEAFVMGTERTLSMCCHNALDQHCTL
eukprot:scaffold25753_cov18-Prasinocladus_malaysianus.AAC.1